MSDASTTASFGEWVQRRRQVLDLTQATLAYRVGCAAITIRKIESDERRPSRQMAARLASSLAIDKEGAASFIAVALGEQPVDRLLTSAPASTNPANDLAPQFPMQESNILSTPPYAPRLEGSVANDEIRVVTVVVVGMGHTATTLQSLHPDETVEWLERLHAVIHTIFAEHEIHIEESLEGHVAALFGAPNSHEDDPERALQAALEIQSAALNLDLPLAIGIHSGPAYLKHAQETHANTVLGATVNLALHLQNKARDGQILVSQKVYRQTRRAFSFKLFDSDLNGPGSLETVYLLLHARQHMEKSRGLEGVQPTLIGRDNELAKLEELVNALPTGHGQMVILAGEAGVGKSRLIARLKAKSRMSSVPGFPLLWLEGRCLEMTMTTGYGPFLDLLRAYFAWEPEDDEPARITRILMSLQALVGAEHLSEEQIEKIGPLLGNLFSLHFGNEWDDQLRQMPPEKIRLHTFRAIYELIVALAQRQPLLLVFEDLHWADGASLDLIAQLMEALPSIPVLLLCVCRPQQAHRSNQLATVALRKCPGHITEIILRELPPRQSRALLHALLGADLPDKVTHVILTRTQGNPFFIEEMVHTLISMDLLYQVENCWQVRANFDDAIVPDSVQNLLLSRVDRLSPAQKSILHHAAVIGRHFSLPLLALMISTQIDHDDLLWQLEEHAFIYQERTIPEVTYSFWHILTHEAIYATIPRRRVQTLHGKVADALEHAYADELAEYYEPLAYHYERSEDRQKAIDYLLKAAQKARRAYLNEEAIGYFSRALACLDELPLDPFHQEQRLTALLDLGQTYYHGTSQLDQAEICFRDALALGKTMQVPPRRLARILVWLGDILMNWQPRFDESLCLGHEALIMLGNDNECSEAGLANALISLSHLMVGEIEEANVYGLRSATFAHRLPCTEELDHLVYLSINCAYMNYREIEEARRWLELSARNATRNQHLHALGEATTCLAYISEVIGDTRRGIAEKQKAMELMIQAGDVKRLNWGQMAMLWAYLQLGETEAIKQLSPLTLANAHLVNQEYLYDIYFYFGIAALTEGMCQEAESYLCQAIERSEPSSSPWCESNTALGYTYLAQGRVDTAANVFKLVVSAALALPDFAPRATRMARQHHAPLVNALSGLEAALNEDAALRTFCAGLQAERLDSGSSRFMQWYLEGAEIDPTFEKGMATSVTGQGRIIDPKIETSSIHEKWRWQDLFGDCSITYDLGITIHAANVRDLWFLNASAPRIMHGIQGDFALQTRCEAFSSEQPALGGIVLWHSLTKFMRLDWGTRGSGEITLMGCIDLEDVIVGRGRLYTAQPYLRLERRGDMVRALCSENGNEWYTVGQIEFTSGAPLEVGLYAIGNIDRMLYRSRYPDGTAIRFSDLYLWSS